MATFWEIAAHSVNRMFSLYYVLFLVVSHFGFESGIVFLIAPDPGHCLLFTFKNGSNKVPLFISILFTICNLVELNFHHENKSV